MNASACRSLYDLGMGTGKFVLQAFVQFKNLIKVVGIELAYSRFVLSEQAALCLITEWPKEYTLVSRVPNQNIIVQNIGPTGQKRMLEFRRGNLFAATDCHDADIVIAQTNFPSETQVKLCRFLGCMKPSCTFVVGKRWWDTLVGHVGGFRIWWTCCTDFVLSVSFFSCVLCCFR